MNACLTGTKLNFWAHQPSKPSIWAQDAGMAEALPQHCCSAWLQHTHILQLQKIWNHRFSWVGGMPPDLPSENVLLLDQLRIAACELYSCRRGANSSLAQHHIWPANFNKLHHWVWAMVSKAYGKHLAVSNARSMRPDRALLLPVVYNWIVC